jgi:hypothetical protein
MSCKRCQPVRATGPELCGSRAGLSLASIVLLVIAVPAFSEPNQGFGDLFNGKDLDGWVIEGATKLADGTPVWQVSDGKIICTAGNQGYGFLRYARQEFGDFTLRVEYRFLPPDGKRPRGNSGIGIRTVPYDPKRSLLTRPSYAAYEIQLLDDAGRPPSKHGTGSLYRYVAPRSNPAKPAPEWNILEVTCRGPNITIALNGQVIVEADQREVPDTTDKPRGAPAPKDKPLRGYICLQSHTGTVEFRRVQIREIPAKPADGQ